MWTIVAWLSTAIAGATLTLAGLLYVFDPGRDHVLRSWTSSGWPWMSEAAMFAPMALLVGGIILAVISAVSLACRRPPDGAAAGNGGMSRALAWLVAVPPANGFVTAITRILSNPAGQYGFSLVVVLPLAVVAASLGHLAWANAIVLVGLVPLAVFLVLRTIEALDTERLEVDTHWGGLGGGMGGWRMSRAAVLLLLAIVTTGGVIAAGVTGAPSTTTNRSASAPSKDPAPATTPAPAPAPKPAPDSPDNKP